MKVLISLFIDLLTNSELKEAEKLTFGSVIKKEIKKLPKTAKYTGIVNKIINIKDLKDYAPNNIKKFMKLFGNNFVKDMDQETRIKQLVRKSSTLKNTATKNILKLNDILFISQNVPDLPRLPRKMSPSQKIKFLEKRIARLNQGKLPRRRLDFTPLQNLQKKGMYYSETFVKYGKSDRAGVWNAMLKEMEDDGVRQLTRKGDFNKTYEQKGTRRMNNQMLQGFEDDGMKINTNKFIRDINKIDEI